MAWELMSLGGAVMILSERLSLSTGGTGPVHAGAAGGRRDRPADRLPGASSPPANGLSFVLHLAARARDTARLGADPIGVLLVIGFGAKLGLLPFYEWFPGAYGAGSGASGAILSGVVLNAAFFGLSRGLLDWVPGTGDGAMGSASSSWRSASSVRSWQCSTRFSRRIGGPC